MQKGKMKILIIAPYFYPMADVSCVRINSLCQYMINQGDNITIIRNKEYDNCFEIDIENPLAKVETHYVDTKNSRNYKQLSTLYLQEFEKVVKKNTFDLVFITMGPFYSLPICSISKEKYHIPCILDYRDLWLFDMRKKTDFFSPRMLIRKIKGFPIEKKNISAADMVVTVTEKWSNILKTIYRGNKNKYCVVANGYDDVLLKQSENIVTRKIPTGDFNIAVFGKFAYYSEKYAKEVFEAILRLDKDGINVKIIHIGNTEKQMDILLNAHPEYKKYYYNSGFLPYGEGIQIIKQCQASLLVDIRNGAMGTKFYDYVYANVPLLYIGAPHTHLAKLVNTFPGGFVCSEIDDVYRTIKNVISKKIVALTNEYDYEKYSRTEQNKKYYNIIMELTKIDVNL